MRTMMMLVALVLAGSAVVARATEEADVTAVKSTLGAYKTALERLDLAGVDELFAPDNVVLENGKLEGSYADYRDHHIGPELGPFESFEFSDYVVAVRLEGPLALATETYRYTIRLRDKPEPIEREGAATSVLKKIGGKWKILSMHNSSRTPKPKPAA